MCDGGFWSRIHGVPLLSRRDTGAAFTHDLPCLFRRSLLAVAQSGESIMAVDRVLRMFCAHRVGGERARQLRLHKKRRRNEVTLCSPLAEWNGWRRKNHPRAGSQGTPREATRALRMSAGADACDAVCG